MNTWPRLSVEAQKKILADETEAKAQLGDNVRPYTPGNPDWLRTRENILEGGYRVIDFVCSYVEIIFDIYAAAYDLSALTSTGVLTERILPLTKRMADKAWGGWLWATAFPERPTIAPDGPRKPGDIEFDLPPRLSRATGAKRGVLSVADIPVDSQLAAGLAQLQERYREQIVETLDGRTSAWQQRSLPVARPGHNPRSTIDAFIQNVARAGAKINRTDIWTVAGYKDRTEFERYQRKSTRTTASATKNLGRVLSLSPEAFLLELEKKKRRK
ncbi:MAG: hypothetical protein LAP40_12535 [Acidobacteriia bacterium]|nr:hypothetical protein [Terriglobia bacterium]